MKIYSNEYAQKIYDILTPLIGEMMAKGCIKTHSIAAGVTEETIRKTDLPQIVERIRKGLVIFVGSETAARIAQKLLFIK